MPRKSGSIPAYSLHRSSGQAIVRIGGHDHYLGLHDSPDSREKYDRLIAEWLSKGRQPIAVTTTPDCGLLVNELLLKFVDHAERYCLLDGEISKEVVNIKLALRPVKNLYGSTLAKYFRQNALKAVREHMVAAQ